jgi:hypothetical protein
MRVAVKDGDASIAEVAVDFTGKNAAMPLGEGMTLEKRHAVRFAGAE